MGCVLFSAQTAEVFCLRDTGLALFSVVVSLSSSIIKASRSSKEDSLSAEVVRSQDT